MHAARSISSALLISLLAGCGSETPVTQPSQETPSANGPAGTPAGNPYDTSANAPSTMRGRSSNSFVFPRQAHPFGASLATWADREAQWIYGLPVEHNPLIDQTGEDCDVAQTGPVWFLPRIAGPLVFSGARRCTIPHGKAILLEIGAYVNPYPCPDPNFRPAPGQSLYDFLIGGARDFMNGVNRLEVSLDGQPIPDALSYRFSSPDLFTLTGDPSFSALDPCVTGTPQPAVSDGFFMMFKPLQRGTHVIRVYGTDVYGADKTYVYYLTIA